MVHRCSSCGKTYANQNSLVRHAHLHRNKKRHVCDQCGVVFYRRDLLSRHSRLHKDPENQDDSISRKRCHTACLACRELRVKCSGSEPCESCINLGKTCEYEVPARRISRLTRPMPPSPDDSSPGAELGSGTSEPLPSQNHSPPQETHSDWSVDLSQGHGQPPFDAGQAEGNPELALTPSLLLPETSTGLFLPPIPVPSMPSTSHTVEPFQPGNSPAQYGLEPLMHDSNQPNFFQDTLSFSFDTVSWPILHENLHLLSQPDEVLYFEGGSSLADLPVPRTNDNQNPSGGLGENGVIDHNPAQADDCPPAPATPVSVQLSHAPAESDKIMHHGQPGPGTPPTELQVIEELISYACQHCEASDAGCDHMSFWRNASVRVAVAFRIPNQTQQSKPQLLENYINLYLKYFEPLWPLFSPHNFDVNRLPPLLFLVLTSIGAMYADDSSSHYGSTLHNHVRSCLARPLELSETEGDFLWLAQARVHSQVAALYFGQPKAFSYAQHLGSTVVGHARRIDLFSGDYVDKCMRRFHELEGVASDQDRLALWLHVESRRMLAFAIFRADAYTSALLQKRPLVCMEDLDLALPSCEVVWQGGKLPPAACLEMIRNDRTPGRQLRASDVYRIALDRQEPLPVLDPIGFELLLLGLQWPIWRVRKDPGTITRLTRDVGMGCGESHHDRGMSVAHPDPLNSSLRPILTSTSEMESLHNPVRPMNDLETEYSRLKSALVKTERSISTVKGFVHSERDRCSLMSSMVLYHMGYMLLYAPINDLHLVHYLLVDKKPIDNEKRDLIRHWVSSPLARHAAERAVSIWNLIYNSATKDNTPGIRFNLLAFLALHHAAVLLWAYSQIHEPSSTEHAQPSALALSPTGEASIPITRDKTKAILDRFVQAYSLISPSRWSSFQKAVEALSFIRFPVNAPGQ